MNVARTGIIFLLCFCLVYEIQGGLLDFLKGDFDTHKDTPPPKKVQTNKKTSPHQPTKKVENSKKKPPGILDAVNGLVSSVATGDRIKTLIVLIDVELGDKGLAPIELFLLKCARKILTWIHPIYLKLFPQKADRGSLEGNLEAGADGLIDTVKKAGKVAQVFGKMFVSSLFPKS